LRELHDAGRRLLSESVHISVPMISMQQPPDVLLFIEAPNGSPVPFRVTIDAATCA
jgi:hypothetical protein